MLERLLYIGNITTSRNVIAYLEQKGYVVRHVKGLRPALRAIAEFDAQLILINADDTSIINLHRITHTAGRKDDRPFILLLGSSRSNSFGGATFDELLILPFTNRRLEQRIRKLLDNRTNYIISLGDLVLDRRTECIRIPQGTVRLTPKQFQLLDFLVMHAGSIVTRKQIMEAVWETSYLGDTRTLDVHIRWLRQQIEVDPNHPQLIVTHRGKGYSLEMEGTPKIGGDPILSILDHQDTGSTSASIPSSP